MSNAILTFNGGASGIKFAVYEPGISPAQLLYGEIENIGTESASFHFLDSSSPQKKKVALACGDLDTTLFFLMDWLEKQAVFDSIKAAGHRIAYGSKQKTAQLITPELLSELKKDYDDAEQHFSLDIALIEIFKSRHPKILQIACYDTSFLLYRPLGPDLLTLLPVRKEATLEPYGFHGFSFEYLLEELNRVAGDGAAQGRVILAHLDSRKSVGAYRNGKPIDFSEDLTAPYSLHQDTLHTGGLRTQPEKNNTPLFASSTNQDAASPMASATDFKTTVLTDDQSKYTKENTRRFCYDTRKSIGSLAAALEGLDTLVFTGSIGEHGPDVRSGICDGLAFLGIDLDEVKNMNNEYIVSTDTSAVTVRIIKTNEEIIMARLVSTILNF